MLRLTSSVSAASYSASCPSLTQSYIVIERSAHSRSRTSQSLFQSRPSPTTHLLILPGDCLSAQRYYLRAAWIPSPFWRSRLSTNTLAAVPLIDTLLSDNFLSISCTTFSASCQPAITVVHQYHNSSLSIFGTWAVGTLYSVSSLPPALRRPHDWMHFIRCSLHPACP